MTQSQVGSVLNLPNELRMLDVVRDALQRAEDVRIAVSFTRCSGLGLLIDPLCDLASRGGQVRILTSTYQSITQPEALEALRKLPGVETRVQSGPIGFHAKFWWFRGQEGQECWAGSSNLSKGGLATNLEWNLRRIDSEAIHQTRRQFDDLWRRQDTFAPDDDFIHTYRQIYREATLSPKTEGGMDGSGLLFESRKAPEKVAPNQAQMEALEQLRALRKRGERRAAVIAATGIGKTYLSAFDFLQSQSKTLLYVSHRIEHLLQARRVYELLVGPGRTGLVGGGQEQSTADLVFATVASLRGRPELTQRHFDYLVIDEFHHVQAPSYEILRPLRQGAFLLGMTATPDRQDGHDVLEWCDWNVAYDLRLPEAIDRQWLLPFHYFGIADETVDFLKIPWRRLELVEDALSVEARADHILRHALERGFDGPRRATIGFCAGLKHARFMADAFLRRGQHALSISGQLHIEDREEVYRRLSDPEDPLEWLFVADLLNEGVDIPAINSILFLRPTESATLFLQQLGRGLRLHPGTEVLTVLDFVGHHRSAWLTLQALDAPSAGGRRTEIAQGVVIKPPKSCEVVLQSRTREILAKVQRHGSKREACSEAYQALRSELGRPPLPVDLWNRSDLPDMAAFKAAYRNWIACQRANSDEPPWARGLQGNHLALDFLHCIEGNWQAQRVSPYALVWGLCARPDDPPAGYELFFERWPQWRSERSELAGSKTWKTVADKLGESLIAGKLHPSLLAILDRHLLPEVEGRIFYTINRDHQERHGGVLRSPSDLNLHASYQRPEIIRHFGVHYDPARHNTGMLWFDQHGVIITKLDTSSATARHQYANRFLNHREFCWTSQNKMATTNEPGRRLIEHQGRGLRIHLFVQPRSHKPACYVGIVQVVGAEGDGPMRVTFNFDIPVPKDVLGELMGQEPPD